MGNLRIIAFGLLLSTLASAQVLSSFKLSGIADQRLSAVAKEYEVHREADGSFEVFVPAGERARLLQIAPEAELNEVDIKDIFRRMDREEPGWRAGYHTYAQVETIFKDYDKNFAKIAKLEQYGTTGQGRPLYALHLSVAPANAPEILLTAATHGDELITVEVLLAITDRLVQGYGSDPRINRILSAYNLYIIPAVNADGFVSKDRYDNGRDPNRSFPWPGNASATPTPAIKEMIKFFHSHNFVGSIDFHASGQLLMFPWAYTDGLVGKDELAWFKTTTQAMAKVNGYTAGQISHILYVAQGSSADYYHWKNKTYALGIEMATTKVPSTAQIPNVVKENMESTLLFLEHF